MFNSELGTANISSVPCNARYLYPWLQKLCLSLELPHLHGWVHGRPPSEDAWACMISRWSSYT